MNTIEYKLSTRWKDNLTETADKIINEQKTKIYAKAEAASVLNFTIKYDSKERVFGIFGTKKKIVTTANVYYNDPSKIISSNFHVN